MPLHRADLRRYAVPLGVLAGVLFVALALGGPARTAADAFSRLLDADPRWVALGIAFEAVSFTGYILLLWHVAGRGSSRIGFAASAHVTLAGAAATRALPTAGAGGAALTLWALRRGGHPGRAGVRTLLAFLVVLYAVFLGAILVVGGLAAAGVLHTGGPRALAGIPALGAGAAIAIALALGLRTPRHLAPAGARLHRLRGGLALLGHGVRDAVGLVRGGDLRLAGAPVWWAFDVAVLYATFHAIGAHPPVAVVVLGYFVGQVANTVPVPGSASGGMIGVLIAFHVAPEVAIGAVAAYRAIAVWLPAPAGAASLAALRRTVARWEGDRGESVREVGPAPAPVAMPGRVAAA